MFRRSKIIATLGPSLDSFDACRDVIQAGANVFRLNFSHGTHEQHRRSMNMVEEVSKEVGVPVAFMADLQGPKIRVGSFENQMISLKQGQDFFIDTDPKEYLGSLQGVWTNYSALLDDVKPGSHILLRDGMVILEVLSIEGTKVHTRVVQADDLRDHAGLNLKGGGISASAVTKKDIEDALFSLDLKVDYLALSFVRSADDVKQLRDLCAKHGGHHVGIVSKIERIETISCLEEIIGVSDAIMVARGDLAIEVGHAEVPAIQKEIVKLARKHAKPAIVATQILESMCHSHVPTRAEVSDIANAVLDGADALMLSAESAIGDNPKQVVDVMHETSLSVEKYMRGKKNFDEPDMSGGCQMDIAIAFASIYLSQRVPIKAIVALTEQGKTAFWMSRSYTDVPIVALTPNLATQKRLLLYQGLQPFYFDVNEHVGQDLYTEVIKFVKVNLQLDTGDVILLTRGSQIGLPGKTNSIRLLEVF